MVAYVEKANEWAPAAAADMRVGSHFVTPVPLACQICKGFAASRTSVNIVALDGLYEQHPYVTMLGFTPLQISIEDFNSKRVQRNLNTSDLVARNFGH